MATLFISDLHLRAERPDIAEAFLAFLENHAQEAEALYILGDLFEAWLGDDGILPDYQPAIDALRALTSRGVPVFVMHGNRDFLMGEGFAKLTGCRLLEETEVIDLYGTPTLLMHGDTLCTDDVEYQAFRKMVRDPAWQAKVLAMPLPERIKLAQQLRETSKEKTGLKAMDIMDANADAIDQTMRSHGVRHLIHGHTHRPAVHQLSLQNQPAMRIVLGDWDNGVSFLVCDEKGFRLDDARVTDKEGILEKTA